MKMLKYKDNVVQSKAVAKAFAVWVSVKANNLHLAYSDKIVQD